MLLYQKYQNKEIRIFGVVSIPGNGGKCALFSGIVKIIAATGFSAVPFCRMRKHCVISGIIKIRLDLGGFKDSRTFHVS